MSIKLIYLFNIECNFPENEVEHLCFLMYREGVIQSVAWVTITFSLSTAASTDVPL
jgi:hypothetical protein